MIKSSPGIWVKIGCWGLVITLMMAPEALAIVGQVHTEKMDAFQEEELQEFQRDIVAEESRAHNLRQMEMQKNMNAASGAKDEELERQIQDLQSELLQIPKRDRFKIEMNGSYQYDTNIIRGLPRKEKDDSLFDTNGTLLFDLSGKKTDLRFEAGMGRHWSWEFPEGDSNTIDGRLRYRRKYFKKLQHSQQWNLSRNSSKTLEINQNKIKYDSGSASTWNYAFSKKLGLNLDFGSTMHTFTQEAFDQDSSWEASFAPSGFWSITPKSRISLGYSLAANRIRTKSGNSNAHSIILGYFGKITGKSSASVNLGVNHQTPKSRDTATSNGYTVGTGYIWQMTPKTQLTTQLTRGVTNSTSDLVSGSLDGENTTVKSDSYVVNNSFALSLNTRLSSRITVGGNTSISHSNNKVLRDGDKETEGTQFTVPMGITVTLILKRWAALNLGYTFSYRWGYEKSDMSRDHLWAGSLRLSLF